MWSEHWWAVCVSCKVACGACACPLSPIISEWLCDILQQYLLMSHGFLQQQGAVACHLHDEDPNAKSPLNLLLVHCHLYGTNKYGVPEAVFDKVFLRVSLCFMYLSCFYPSSGTSAPFPSLSLMFRTHVYARACGACPQPTNSLLSQLSILIPFEIIGILPVS